MAGEYSDAAITKSKKAIAFSKATMLVLIFFVIVSSFGAVIVILDNQNDTAFKILDCTVPSGVCYQEKTSELVRRQQTDVGSAVEYCATVSNQSVAAIRECVEKELANG